MLPERSEGDPAALVVAWLCQCGEWVRRGEPLVRLNDGAAMWTLECPVDGVLFRILAEPGQTVEAGEPLAVFSGVDPRPAAVPEPTVDPPQSVHTLSARQRALADHAVRSFHAAPHIVTEAVVDLGEVERLRARAATLPILPFVAAAAAQTLARIPALNCRWGNDGEIRRYASVHLALPLAVDHDPGIAAPVLRDAARLSVLALAREIAALFTAARAGTLDPAQQPRATFTLTDLSQTGVRTQTPVVHQPQGGHLVLGAVDHGRATLTLAHDARIADGFAAAAFLGEVRRELEEGRFLYL